MTLILLAHFFGIIAFIIIATSFWHKTRKNLLIWQAVGKGFKALNFLLLGATTAGFFNILMLFRNFIFADKNKHQQLFDKKIPLYFIIVICIILTIIAFDNFYTLILGASTIFYTIVMWNNNPKIIRIGTLIKEPIWMIYSIIVGAWIMLLIYIFTFVSVLFSYIKYDTQLFKKN